MNNNLDNELQVEALGDGVSMPLCAPPLQTAEYPVALTSIHKVLRRLDRDTTLVAAGLLVLSRINNYTQVYAAFFSPLFGLVHPGEISSNR